MVDDVVQSTAAEATTAASVDNDEVTVPVVDDATSMTTKQHVFKLKTTLLPLQTQSKRLKNWPIVNRSVLPLTKKLVDFWSISSHVQNVNNGFRNRFVSLKYLLGLGMIFSRSCEFISKNDRGI